MRVLLTSAGLETEEIQSYFINMVNQDMSTVKALFIPTAANNPGAIAVLPKCMEDLWNCGILESNITVFDLHTGMRLEELQKFDVVYLCGGSPRYLLERINATEFNITLMEYIKVNGVVLGVSAGSMIFANNLPDNLGLIDTKLHVHCAEGEMAGKISCRGKQENKERLPISLKASIRLTNFSAMVIKGIDDVEIIGRNMVREEN